MSRKLAVWMGIATLSCVAGQGRPLEDPATSAALHGPVLGWVFDSAGGTLRPIAGTAGAATLGQPFDWGEKAVKAAVSPRQDYALALAGRARLVKLLRFENGVVSPRALAGVPAAPDRIALSPTGSAAALSYQSAAVIRVLTGLPDAPADARTIDISGFSFPVSMLAVSDDGQMVLAASAGTEAGACVLFGSTGRAAQVPIPGAPAALAFRPGTHDAVVADSDNRVTLLRDVAGETRYQVLATQSDGISGPVAVAFSPGGERVFIANFNTGTVVSVETGGGSLTLVPCHCTPTRLDRLNGAAVFRLNELSDNPLLLFDASGSSPRVLFVPRGPAAQPQGTAQ